MKWWAGWRGEFVMVLFACSLVLVAFPTIPLGGRSFMTSWKAPRVNGFNPPPPGTDVPHDGIRADAGASAWQFEPWAEVTSDAWSDGDIPLWNPHEGMGTPHAGAFQTAVFDPFLALVNVRPTPLMWDFSFLLAFCLGAAAMYLFLRQYGLDRLPALVGTGVFIWSGYFFRYSNNHFFRSYLYLPVLFLLARRTVMSRSLLAPVGLGVGVAGNLLVGMPEPSMFVLGALALYCGYLLAFPPVPIRRGPMFARFAGAAALGGALAAPLLLPGVEFISLSFNSHSPDAHLGLMGDPPNEIIRWIMPYVLGLRDGPFAATRNWVGMAAFVAVLGAMAAPKALRRYDGWFFFLLGFAIVAKAYNLFGTRLVGHLPVLEQAIIPVYAVPVAGFCIAVLTATAVQAARNREIRRMRLVAMSAVFIAVVALLLVENRQLIDALPAGQPGRQLLLATAAASFVLGAFFFLRKPSAALVAGVVLVELCLLIPRGIQVERVDGFVRPGWLQYIAARVGDSRDRVFGIDAMLFPNTASAYGLADIRSLNALYPQRYVTYIKTFIQPDFVDRFIGGPPFGEARRGETDNNPMFDLTGVRYIVAAGQEPGDLVIRDFFAASPPSETVRPSKINLNGDLRSVILVAPGATTTLPVPSGATKLAYAAARDSAPPGPAGAAIVRDHSDGRVLATTALPPNQSAWMEGAVDLPPGTSHVTLAAAGSSVGFGTLRFAYSGSVPPRQYIHVTSSDGAEVYENLSARPRVLVVPEVVAVPDEDGALDYFRSVSTRLPSKALRVRSFEPDRSAVVEGISEDTARTLGGCEPGRARISAYETRRVVVEVDTACAGLLRLTDMFYPGWKARVNGRPAKIHPTDIAFRGVVVPGGRSTVEFRYAPRTFTLGVLLAAVAATSATAVLVVSGLSGRRKSRVGSRPASHPSDGDSV